MPNYSTNFWNNVVWRLETDQFDSSFSYRSNTTKLLHSYSQEINTALLAIDWSKFSSNVLIVDASDKDILDVDFLKEWTDGVIMTWLNDIDKNRFEWKSAVGILLWVADCAPILGSSSDWWFMFNIHWWYKWILWNWEQDNPWILYNFIQKLESEWVNPNQIWKIHLWPMAWNNFELPLDYYKELTKNISKEYKLLDFWEYIIPNFKYNDKGQRLWYLDLWWLIDIILRYHWVSMYNIENSWIITNDPNNNWPSYRLYSNLLQENNNRLSATITKLLI
jgi:copper oxidase (laccase) domain-containing protein